MAREPPSGAFEEQAWQGYGLNALCDAEFEHI